MTIIQVYQNNVTDTQLNPSQFQQRKRCKESLEELNNFDFNIIKPKTPGSIPVKGSVKEMILREEVNNWFVLKTKYGGSVHKEYVLV